MQGFNMGRYYAPSADSPPKFNSSSSLRAATRKNASTGAQTVRFEMPFHIWCDTCPQPTIIPQGVRFNAEKRKIGMYLSTSIWSFKMKHAACGGVVEIRTDPKQGEYLVHEGGRRRDYGGEKDGEAGLEGLMLSEAERERRRDDAFAALEGKVEDKTRAKTEGDRIDELRALRERDWADPFQASKRLRREFRAERKVREKQQAHDENLKERLGLGMELLDETEDDKRRAELVDFGSTELDTSAVVKRPLFADAEKTASSKVMDRKGLTKAEKEATVRKEKLAHEIRGNTRAVMDPFLSNQNRTKADVKAGLLRPKRKRADAEVEKTAASTVDEQVVSRRAVESRPPSHAAKTFSLGLAEYDDDSE